jgi:uncharacterized RDD family membrane protein YckC
MAQSPELLERERPAEASPTSAARDDPQEVLGRRIAAALVDMGLLFLVFLVLGLLIGDSESGNGGGSVSLTGAGFLVFVGITLLYYFVLEAATGQTLGKRLLGIRVRSVDGGEAGGGAVAIRTLLRLIDSVPFLYLLGFIVMMVTPRRQRLGDLAGRTVVSRA